MKLWLNLTITGVLAAAGALVGFAPNVEACGGFFPPAQLSSSARPSLRGERVLLIHDADRNREHFIREVAFQRANAAFGFVVPTPTQPEVHAIEHAPFDELEKEFMTISLGNVGFGGSGGGGADGGGPPPLVEVLEKKKVGSFTAFVLAATDEQALTGWLADNGLVTTPETEPWLAHYVNQKFFYVAMRYDPPEDGSKVGEQTTETMRISFDSPLAYYPYREPESPDASHRTERELRLWVVSSERLTPLAMKTDGAKREWVRPFKQNNIEQDAREHLLETVDDEIEALLPDGELTVETFDDRKERRTGFGDVLFAPYQHKTLDNEERRQLLPYLSILDSSLPVVPR